MQSLRTNRAARVLRGPAIGAIAVLALVPVLGRASPVAGASSPDPGTLVPAPGYYRPVIVGGKAFPLARANFLSFIEIEKDWHAPRLRVVNGTWQLVGRHEGIDIMAERGTPVVSMTSGRVENVGWLFYSGERIGIRGTDGRYYFYAHLSAIAPGIVQGASVSPGTLLGLVGNTGYGPPGERDQFPPHLHFGIEAGSTWVDPRATLVSLYDSTVTAEGHQQADLDELAMAGRTRDWTERARRLYMRPAFGPRE